MEAPMDLPVHNDGPVIINEPYLAPCEKELLGFILEEGCTDLQFDVDSKYYIESEVVNVAEFIDGILADDDADFVNQSFRKVYHEYFKLYDEGLTQQQIQTLCDFGTAVVAGDDCKEMKPSAAPLRLAASRMRGHRLSSHDWMVGDNWTDMDSGANAGVKTAFCTYGFGRLGESRCTIKINRLDELLRHYGIKGNIALLANKVYNVSAKTYDNSAIATWQKYLDTGRWQLSSHSVTHNFWGLTDKAETVTYVNSGGSEVTVTFEEGADVAATMQAVYKSCKVVEDDCVIYL
jgi:histidinol phosphatase-like enzyme